MTDKLVKWLRGELPMGDDCIAPDRICVAGDCECDSANQIAAADRIESQLKLIDVSGKINNQLMELVLEQKNHIDELEAALDVIASNNGLALSWMSTAPMPLERYKDNCYEMMNIARAALGEKKMTEQTPQDAYIESCLIDLSKKLTAAEERNKELEAALREIEMLHYDSETDFHHDAMKAHDIARAALGEKKNGN